VTARPDREVVPRLLVLTDRHQAEAANRDLRGTVARAVAAGAPSIVLREKDLPRSARRALADGLVEVVRDAGARLLVASDATLAVAVGADGVHLAADDPPVAADLAAELTWIGRSCHDADEVARAGDERCDYVTVSPVASSASKPGYGPPLGPDGLAALVAASRVPVVALGGVTAANAGTWRRAGAHGVAVMGAVAGADDVGASVRSLLSATHEVAR
jgi:thiamine-phosphate pyrophosphorylase